MKTKEYNRDTKYWNEYYKRNGAPNEKSLFAEFVSKYIETGRTLLDCGCGNGRDSIFFSSIGMKVTSVDASNETINALKEKFHDKLMNLICADFVASDLVWGGKKYYYIYSRFSLHAISKEQQDIFFNNVCNSLHENGLFFIEVRSINDELFGKGEKISNNEYYYENHYRRFLKLEELVFDLELFGLKIEYAAEKRNFAKYNNQNPPIIRIIARKTDRQSNLFKKLEAYIDDNDFFSNVLNSEPLKSQNLYIFGAGDRAQWLGKILKKNNVDFNGFLVSRKYYSAHTMANMYGYEKNIYCLEEKINKKEKMVILLGIAQSLLSRKMFIDKDVDSIIGVNIGNRDDYVFDYKTLLEHKKELEWFYDSLGDKYSKDCLFYCIRGRMTCRDFDFIPSEWSKPEYFLEGFIEWKQHECIVDCGAYDGDTIEEFLKKKPLDSDFKYKVFAFEPDISNYKKLNEKFKNNKEIVCINKATYSRAELIGFTSDGGEMSTISDNAKFTVEADTIDNILQDEKATFIKMDVEGSELQSLMGAEKQIRDNKPRLAICIYHKQEDFWTIPQYIKKIRPDYKFYLKTHSSMPTELVLFCV